MINTRSAALSQQIFYIEPINTNDLDVFFHVKQTSHQIQILKPLYRYLSGLGYRTKGETIEIEDWPVQFLPVFNPLLEEAVADAREVTFKRTKTQVMTAQALSCNNAPNRPTQGLCANTTVLSA